MRQATHEDSYRFAQFQSTHPLRDATEALIPSALDGLISIHAPLTGCDNAVNELVDGYVSISIHAPLTGCDHEL